MGDGDERFGPDEVHAILTRALERPRGGEDEFSREELFEVARRAGIPDPDLEAAIVAVAEDREIEKERARLTQRNRSGFGVHLFVFTMVNAGLYLALHGLAWPMLLGWGAGLALHALRALSPARISRERLRRRVERRKRKEAWRKTARAVEDAAHRGIAQVAEAVVREAGRTKPSRPVRVTPPPSDAEDAEIVETPADRRRSRPR